jgi:predicted nucleic acid-binding protein
MGILIDSETLLAWAEAPAELEAWAGKRGGEECYLSIITADELLRAVAEATDRKVKNRRLAFVESILEQLPVLPIDRQIARIHAEIRQSPLAGGRMREPDGWLAATSIAHGLLLVTLRPEVFRQVPGLLCESAGEGR